jgi:hypothetical protein
MTRARNQVELALLDCPVRNDSSTVFVYSRVLVLHAHFVFRLMSTSAISGANRFSSG